ncbi:MAG: hypothetical protein AAGK22_16575 [Acidobacteriota bacterium]
MTDLEERGRALEERFFANQDRELIEKARAERAESEERASLAEVTGITDESLLESIMAAGVSADSAAALSLAPLVIVAWSDGQIQELERKAILDAAKESGVTDAGSHQLIESWLSERPSPELVDAWEACTADLAARLSDVERAKLAEEILGNARKVAAAAGGVLGLAKTSSDEKEALERLEAALS